MPTYEYECQNCGERFEEFQSITADPLNICKLCKNGPVKRLISAGAGLIFKGSGFYQTDYKSTTPPPSTPESKPSEHKAADPAKATDPKTYKKS